LEKIDHIEISSKAAYLRTMLFELERIHSHLLLLGVVAQEIGFTTMFMHTFHLRENILDLFEQITGNRIHHAMNLIGGVRWDLTPKMVTSVHESMKVLESSLKLIHEAFQDKTAEKRLCGVGILDPADARELGVVGPVARGSSLAIDARKDTPYAAYKDLADAFSIITMRGADAYARVEVRILELSESINIIRAALDRLPNGPLMKGENPIRVVKRIPAGETVSAVEAPRGELFYYIKTNGKEGLSRLSIRTPTFANIVALKKLLVGGEIADIPAALASIDPCISCTTRMIVLPSR
jgi:Ni,Fe-hydrogenase III large subunit